MDTIVLFFVLAITVEGIVEYVKTLISQERKAIYLQVGALATSILLCVLSGADIYAALGVQFAFPVMGCVLTGIFASRGANYANDILGRLQKHNA